MTTLCLSERDREIIRLALTLGLDKLSIDARLRAVEIAGHMEGADVDLHIPRRSSDARG